MNNQKKFTTHATSSFRYTESDKYSCADRSVLPNELLDGMHRCLEAGMTATQVSAALLLIAGLFKMGDCNSIDLLARIKNILMVIEHDQSLTSWSDEESVF